MVILPLIVTNLPRRRGRALAVAGNVGGRASPVIGRRHCIPVTAKTLGFLRNSCVARRYIHRGVARPKSAIVELRPAMLGWAVRCVGDVEAEDLVQDACLRVVTINRAPRTSYPVPISDVALLLPRAWDA